jgi:DegV family protein with EDD domain
MGVRIVTDTSCDLPAKLEEELRESEVQAIPFAFHFGQEAHLDKSMPMSEYLARASQVWPTTAAPSVGSFVQAYQKVVDAGHQVLCLPITSRHSATYNSALLAAESFSPEQVQVRDTAALSLAQGLLVLAAVRAARLGGTLEQVMARVHDVQQRMRFYIGLDTVDYLVKGGRASRLTGLLASLLNLRPILTLHEGELTLIEKPRKRSVAKERLIALAKACLPAEAIGVMHVACPDEALQLAEDMARESGMPMEQIALAETGMALATHGGPGALGVVVVSRAAA